MATFLAILFLFSSGCFFLIGVTIGPHLPAGATPFYALGGICALLSVWAWRSRSTETPDFPQVFLPSGDENWVQRKRREFANFDLSRLNFYGWALFLSSVAIFLLQVFAFVHFLDDAVNRLAQKVLALFALIVAALWFQVGKRLFEWVGASIYGPSVGESPEQ
jgi:hypothetical protein